MIRKYFFSQSNPAIQVRFYEYHVYRMAPNFRGRKFSYKTLNLTKLNFWDKIFVN